MSQNVLGWVYILTNESFKEGMIKIGFTNKPTPQERAQELSKHTGVPTEFHVVYAIQIANAHQIEGRVHERLQHKRARNNREFFECSIAEAVQTIKSVAGRNIVKTMDYRKGQPEKSTHHDSLAQHTPSKSHSSTPKHKAQTTMKSKQKSKGIIFTLLILIILFFAAMLFIGWRVEQKETPSSQAKMPQQNIAQTTTQPEITNDAHTPAHLKLENARQNMQLAWDKIPPEIQKDLQSEQDKWWRDTQKNCQQKNDCFIKSYEKRAQYLQGYSIH